MKESVIVKSGDKVLYKGRILDIPLKEEYIIQKSIDIFNDDDPCIIHQSFVIKEIVSNIIDLFKNNNSKVLNCIQFPKEFAVLNFPDLSSLTIELEVK